MSGDMAKPAYKYRLNLQRPFYIFALQFLPGALVARSAYL